MTTRQRLPRADQLLSSLDTYVLSFAPVPTIPYYPHTGNQWPFIIMLAVLSFYTGPSLHMFMPQEGV